MYTGNHNYDLTLQSLEEFGEGICNLVFDGGENKKCVNMRCKDCPLYSGENLNNHFIKLMEKQNEQA